MRIPILTLLLGFATLSGCVFPGVYKLNVQQGNIVTADMLEQLKPGMNSRQVAYVMGNPVVRNPFEQQRWDYLYTLEQRDKVIKNYTISVYFDAQGNYTHYTGTLPEQAFKEEDQLKTLPTEEKSVNTVPTDI
ncbi:outer membrane protein assembly factor BamE [Thalassolituus sp. C2-1]|uniref:outer membrane protein assembly factor BamE n=1 Tax=Venatorbacter sp. C2-1 TaxID=2597518 RepID=UPI0011962260|nr:outer membrane protein assembly factor BamE [Thalassolituus sp. C2-1]TVV45547.1 outer membrane protein assembly factor BamE [Thalassolituus sp. C2-1]